MILGTELRCFLLFPEELQLSKAPHPAPKGKGFGGGTKRTQKAGDFGDFGYRWDDPELWMAMDKSASFLITFFFCTVNMDCISFSQW